MTIKERAIDAGAVTGTVALVVTAWWAAGVLRDQSGVIATPRPGPTVTATVTTSPPAEAPTYPATPPRPSASSVQAATTVVAAQQSGGRQSASGTGGSAGGGQSGSSPPQSPPAAASCRGTVLSLQLPLGVLPRCALTAGGSR